MNDFSTFLNAERIRPINSRLSAILAAGRFYDGAKGLLHILRLAQLVIAPLKVEAQDRNAPLVHNVGIDFAIGVGIGNHLAATGKSNGVAIDRSEERRGGKEC